MNPEFERMQIAMKRLTILTIATMSILSFFGCGRKGVEYPQDKITTASGEVIMLTFFKHASLSIEVGGQYIYVDPVDEYAEYDNLPKADVLLITHSHYDHLDMAAIDKLRSETTTVICDKTSAEAFEFDCVTMTPGAVTRPLSDVEIEAVPAYNITGDRLQFHPKEREDCGYILTIGGTRLYIAGDTENNDDIKALQNIDVAFLPVNQPFTMTVDQAVDVVKAIRPKIFYPYHYGGTEHTTDIDRLVRELDEITTVRVRPME